MISSLQESPLYSLTPGNKFDRDRIFEGIRVCDHTSNIGARCELKISVVSWREPRLMSLPYPLLLITKCSPF